MPPQIKVLDVELPRKGTEKCDVLRDSIWPVIKPEWNGQEVVEEKLTAGYVNYMAIFHSAEDVDKKDAVIVRVYRSHDSLDDKRDLEFIKMQIACHMGCYPDIHAVLANAVIYQYAPGQNLRAADLRNQAVIKKVASALAQFHWFDSDVDLIDRRGNKTEFHVHNKYLEVIKDNYAKRYTGKEDETAEDRKKRELVYEDIGKQVDFLENYLSDLDLPVCNSHNDFHNNNILYDEQTGRTTILDYEMSGTGNYVTYDFSYLFSMHLFREFIEKMDLATESESDEIKRQWITEYLKRKYELEGHDPAELSPTEVDLWVTYLAITDSLMFFFSALRYMPYLGVEIDLPIKQSFAMNWKCYQERQDSLLQLKEQCFKLRSQLSQ